MEWQRRKRKTGSTSLYSLHAELEQSTQFTVSYIVSQKDSFHTMLLILILVLSEYF